MTTKRQVEIFTAGCPICSETVQLVQRIACESCDVTVLDMNDAAVAERAKEIGVNMVPAVVVNGRLTSTNAALSEQALQETGIGQAL